MRRLLAIAFCAGALLASAAAAGPPSARGELLLGEPYPLEIRVSFPGALLHWMDSLAGVSGVGLTTGKTVEAHQKQFRRIFGEPTERDRQMLKQFMTVRMRFIEDNPSDPEAFVRVFFESATTQQALEAAGALVGDTDAPILERSLQYFVPRYAKIWNDGRLAKAFVTRTRKSRHRKALARFLDEVARFFEVSSADVPRPQILPVPVIEGYGTHAQAIGRHLLIEVRPREGLLEELAPIVHENVHFMMRHMETEKLERFIDIAWDLGPEGIDGWRVLREALPTAVGQGVAQRRFREDLWSLRNRWYDVDEVDRNAKRLYPAVRDAMANGGTLDEAFFRQALKTVAE